MEAEKMSNYFQNNNSLSIFIKPGRLLKEAEKNPYFDFANFEKVKDGKKYNILGSGAFGDVYLVQNKLDGKLFAMKQMDKSRLISVGIKPEVVYREISIHLKLIHDHIARLYSYHEDKKTFYMIMEYVESGTLFSIIQKKNGLSEEDSFKYFIQVTSALNFLHDNSLIHRDLKPENCLIDKNGNVKLCDFGWTVETNKARVTFCGTYEYMAPEIVKEMPYNNAIDVWSLGVLLYELLHSYSPFRAKTKLIENYENYDPSVEVLKNILKFNFKIETQVSDECKDILKRLLNPKFENRITIAEIFKHPWIKNFEERIKAKLHMEEQKNSFKKCNTINADVQVKASNKVNDSPGNYNDTIVDPMNTNVKTILMNNNKLNPKNVAPIKQEPVASVVYKEKEKEPIQSDDMFNSVLDQVQHGKKRNKRKSVSQVNYRFSIENIYKSIEEELKKNKIVLRMEKADNDKPAKSDFQISPIKNNKDSVDESNFSMYKEIKEIDREIDKKTEEKSRRIHDLKKNADKMKEKIQLSSQKNIKTIKYEITEKNNKNANIKEQDEDSDYNKTSNNSNKFMDNLQTQTQTVMTSNSVDSFKETFPHVHYQEHPKFQNQQEKKYYKNSYNQMEYQNSYKNNCKSNYPTKNNYSNYNEEIFFNNSNNLRNSNIKYKKNPPGHKNLKQINKDLELICRKNPFEDSLGNTIDVTTNSDKLPFRFNNKSEMSIQTETPLPTSFWGRFFGFLNTFKCG